MANDIPSPQTTSTAVALFQKAHGRMTTLQRIDEQIAALVDQRRKIQDELRAVQALINEEFDRVVRSNGEVVPNRMLTQIAESARDNNGHLHSRVELTEAVA